MDKLLVVKGYSYAVGRLRELAQDPHLSLQDRGLIRNLADEIEARTEEDTKPVRMMPIARIGR